MLMKYMNTIFVDCSHRFSQAGCKCAVDRSETESSFQRVPSRGTPPSPQTSRTSSEALAAHCPASGPCAASSWPFVLFILELCSVPRHVTHAAPDGVQAGSSISRTGAAPPSCRRCRPGPGRLPGRPCRCLLGPAPPSSCCTPVGDDLG